MIPPAKCETMTDVRTGIDALDRQLVRLLTERMRFIAAAARIKPDRAAVRDEWRKADVLAKVAAAADAEGLPRALSQQLWELLIEASIAAEFEMFDAGRNGASDGARTRDLRRDRPAL